MKKIAIIFLFFILIGSFSTGLTAKAESSNAEQDITNNIDEILANLDTSDIDAFLKSLNDNQMKLFGANSILERLQKIVSGEIKIDYNNFLQYILQLLGVNFLHYMPTMLAIIAIAICFNMISSIKGKFASDSIENIAFFASMSLIVLILLVQIFGLVSQTSKMITNLQSQMNIFFPILLTLMTAIGAGSSVAVYQPAVAVLSSGLVEIIVAIALPAFIFTVVLTIVGNLSEGVKLKQMSSFFSTATKWILSTSFFLFIAFLSIQGITASVYDGISIRTAKFAISKYVPIIGGYLSEGFNLIMAGSVLVKNAVGLSAVLMVIISILPTVVQLVVFSLSLKLAGAIIEPMGDTRISSLLSNISKSITLLIVIILAIAFLYFIFLILVVCTGNLAI